MLRFGAGLQPGELCGAERRLDAGVAVSGPTQVVKYCGPDELMPDVGSALVKDATFPVSKLAAILAMFSCPGWCCDPYAGLTDQGPSLTLRGSLTAPELEPEVAELEPEVADPATTSALDDGVGKNPKMTPCGVLRAHIRLERPGIHGAAGAGVGAVDGVVDGGDGARDTPGTFSNPGAPVYGP